MQRRRASFACEFHVKREPTARVNATGGRSRVRPGARDLRAIFGGVIGGGGNDTGRTGRHPFVIAKRFSRYGVSLPYLLTLNAAPVSRGTLRESSSHERLYHRVTETRPVLLNVLTSRCVLPRASDGAVAVVPRETMAPDWMPRQLWWCSLL